MKHRIIYVLNVSGNFIKALTTYTDRMMRCRMTLLRITTKYLHGYQTKMAISVFLQPLDEMKTTSKSTISPLVQQLGDHSCWMMKYIGERS